MFAGTFAGNLTFDSLEGRQLMLFWCNVNLEYIEDWNKWWKQVYSDEKR